VEWRRGNEGEREEKTGIQRRGGKKEKDRERRRERWWQVRRGIWDEESEKRQKVRRGEEGRKKGRGLGSEKRKRR
jgi:hypothetical protein